MHILDRPDGQRVICAGGQNGEIFLGFYNIGKCIYHSLFKPMFQHCIIDGTETKSHAIRIFSPITSVLIFQPRASNKSKFELIQNDPPSNQLP
jgi:hypothetical protein